jgi:hypothetical protein
MTHLIQPFRVIIRRIRPKADASSHERRLWMRADVFENGQLCSSAWMRQITDAGHFIYHRVA